MITRSVLYATLGTLCSALGYAWNSTEFWSFLGLFWCADFLARNEGRQQGVAMVLDMPIMRIAHLKSVMERIDAGEDVDKEELLKDHKDDK